MPNAAFRRVARLILTLLALLAALPAAAQEDLYRIRPGDVLRIEVVEDNTINRTVLVAPDGRISIPLAGTIQAGGRPIEAIQTSIAQRLAPNFAAEPTVFVSIEQIAAVRETPMAPAAPVEPVTIDLYVLGEVNSPGRVTAEPGTTVLEFFAQIGGFTRFAATKRIQLRRREADGTETIYTLNYDAIIDGSSPNGTATLADGDVLVVPERRLFE